MVRRRQSKRTPFFPTHGRCVSQITSALAVGEVSHAYRLSTALTGSSGRRERRGHPGWYLRLSRASQRKKIAVIASINAAATLEHKRASMAKAGLPWSGRGTDAGAARPPEVNGRFASEGGLAVDGERVVDLEEER